MKNLAALLLNAAWQFFIFILHSSFITAMEENELIPVDNNNAVEYTDTTSVT